MVVTPKLSAGGWSSSRARTGLTAGSSASSSRLALPRSPGSAAASGVGRGGGVRGGGGRGGEGGGQLRVRVQRDGQPAGHPVGGEVVQEPLGRGGVEGP